MPVNKDQQSKTVNGNNFELKTYNTLRSLTDELKINRLKRKKRFYYNEKTIEEMIADEINSSNKRYTKEDVEKLVRKFAKNIINSKSSDVIRSNKKFYKEADISFMTTQKYLYNGKLKNIRFIIDDTTSARTDRLKGKAQDSGVYEKLGFAYIYLIELPDDAHFENYKYPDNERKLCQSAVYDANFCNVYKDENVSLVVRESDLFNLLKYISRNPEKDINKLIENWKKRYYKDMVSKRKTDVENYIDSVVAKSMKLINKEKIR